MIGDLVTVLLMSKRSIGGIIPDVTLKEQHTDTLTITDHPVEQGAAITDHAFKNPAELVMQIGWSNSSLLIDSIISGSLFSGTINSVDDLYGQLLDLQASRTVFDVVTGKRTYSNMLIKQLSTTTDKDTENSLIIEVSMRQIIIVQTAVTTLPPSAVQSQPQNTQSVQNSGTKQPITAPNQSALSILFGG